MSETVSGLSMYHISPQGEMAESFFNQPGAKVSFYKGASLVVAKMGDKQIKPSKVDRDWVRGEISAFSKGSRRRLLRLVATIRRDKEPLFGTLTYPDNFEQDPKQVKKQWDKFTKRLLRRFPSAVVIWRMEPQIRKSGKNKGQIAPHFHLLIWGIQYKDMREFLPVAWYESVGSQDKKHLEAGTSVEKVHSVNGVMYYTAKYIAKSDSFKLPGWGRYWGIVNRDMFQDLQGERVTVEIDNQTAFTLLRYMRRKGSEIYGKNKQTGRTEYKGRRRVPKWGNKYTLIGRADFWAAVIPRITASLE